MPKRSAEESDEYVESAVAKKPKTDKAAAKQEAAALKAAAKEAKDAQKAALKAQKAAAEDEKKGKGLTKKVLAALRKKLKLSAKAKFGAVPTGGAIAGVTRTQMDIAFGAEFVAQHLKGKSGVEFEIATEDVYSVLGGVVEKALYPYGGALVLVTPVVVKWVAKSERLTAKSTFSKQR